MKLSLGSLAIVDLSFWSSLLSCLLTCALVALYASPALPFENHGNIKGEMLRGSRFCLTCHDGTIGRNILSQVFSQGGNFQGDMPGDFCLDRGHPVAVDYLPASLKSRGRLKHPSRLDPAVKLENGQVGCTSCHDSNSQLRAKLVMSNSGSRLCFSCHNL